MTDALKSASITNLDASPVVANTSPNGAKYDSQKYSDSVTVTAAGIAASGSTYKMVRVPTNAYLKHVSLFADSALDTNNSPALTIDVGVYYSDSTTDGTPVALQGTAVADNVIADAFALHAAVSAIALEAGFWTSAKRKQPLWQAAGLSADPGGKFDIVVTVETGAGTGAAVAFTLDVEAVLE